MRIEEAVEHMTTAYLRRIVDSFTKDFPKPEEDRAREIIVQNVDELTDPERIERRLAPDQRRYSTRSLHRNILAALLNKPDRRATEQEIIEDVTALEKQVLAEAEDPETLQYEDESALNTLRNVLEVAVEDDRLSQDELRLIDRLRRHLGVQERSRQILLAQLNHFPQAGNEIHSPSEFSDVLNDLQKLGVVFYCNRLDGGVYLIPEELVPGVKKALGIEMSEKPWRLLLENLMSQHLSTILQENGLPRSGLKEEKVERVIHAGIRPSEALDALNSDELYDVLDGLPGANVSGTKDERIGRIIDYFVNLVIKDVPEEASPAERYYEYLVELARRDRESLLANRVISKDRDMDQAFEDGVCYLFEEKLGLELQSMPGSEHPDGLVELKGGELMMWDTKSKEDVYTFPKTHLRQFKRYIRDSNPRVSCFLVIAPEVRDEAEARAELLKIESGHDTDVALISAENLKWMAEEWRSYGSGSEFAPEVFNVTGILGRSKLEQRMEMLL